MLFYLRVLLLISLFSRPVWLNAQRSYAPNSVLAAGQWYQLATVQAGVHKITGSELQAMGLSLPLPSSQLRLYGRPSFPLSEAPAGPYSDDLTELAIQVEDGGDGQLQTSDFILFYSSGPHYWITDTLRQEFNQQLNSYSDTAYYYLTSGGTGIRIQQAAAVGPASHTITDYQFRYGYEKDLFNLLSSGQEWYGERFLAESNQPVSFPVSLPAPVPGKPVRLTATVAARSVGSPVGFEWLANGAVVASHTIAPVTASSFDLFARENSLSTEFSPAANNSLTLRFSASNSSAIGWLNRFRLLADCRLEWPGEPLAFRSWQGRGPGRIAAYEIAGANSGLRIWKLSDPLQPELLNTAFSANRLRFTDLHEFPEEYLVFDPSAALPSVIRIGPDPNQDLHGAGSADMLIITARGLEQAAGRLANWHLQHDGLSSLVVPVESIYHEFSAGVPDPTAIRDFVKMIYDRSGSGARPSYLLLFGDASFDPKHRVMPAFNGIPSFQSSFSLDPLSTYVSDDYFGFLDDGENINGGLQTNQLDIAIGRIPVSTLETANQYIDKIIAYHQPASRGAWRNELTFIADDEDGNLHLQDMETITALAAGVNDRFQQQKIYLDAYPQESDAAGSRYPQVNQAISDQMQKGTLIWNYTGHGGFRRLADEVILEQPIVEGWQQNGRLPLFVTATCDFAPFVNPTINSLGEYLLTKPNAGAIALMTTTRLVFAYSNRILNANYMEAALERLPEGRYRTLGEAARDAKNKTFAGSDDLFNNLKFTLLGDPALTLAFPKHQVLTTEVNGRPVNQTADTVKALQEITISGIIADSAGQLLSGFNGWVYPVVLDQPYEKSTLGNDPGSQPARFRVQDRALYRGQVRVLEGRFDFSFLIPRDIDYAEGNLRIVYYAADSSSDAQGGYANLVMSGSVPAPADREGPAIVAFLNDSLFRSGDLTGERPVLLLQLRDTSGINVLGRGFGHDISMVVDDATDQPYNLNAFFEADADTYRSGRLRFQLPALADGWHRLRIKAWDLLNNSSETELRFRVRAAAVLEVETLEAWPNPFRNRVRFVFSHNQNQLPIEAQIELFSLQGQLIKKINGTIIANGNRSYMDWDGRNQQGFPVPNGIYVYRLVLRSTNGQTAIKSRQVIRF